MSFKLLFLVSMILLVPASAELKKQKLAPLLAADSLTRVEGEYIVILNNLTDQEVEDHKQAVRRLMGYYMFRENMTSEIMEDHQWSIGTFKGYAARMTDRVRDTVRSMGTVKYVEHNQVFTIQQSCTTEDSPTWGIVRTTFTNRISLFETAYTYNPEMSGQGVTVYIIDSGIYTEHPEFEGRATWGADFIDGQFQDLNGHGTHVAGTVISRTYGLAKKATAVAVRVTDMYGYGSARTLLNGVYYVARQHNTGKKSVANMSLGIRKSRAINEAVESTVQSGVHFAVAAGNEGMNACYVSPASESTCVTVGASDRYDQFASFSNHGKCVDIIAPGVDITSTWIPQQYTRTISGTSMASPHVAGVMAKYLSASPTTLTPAELKRKITRTGSSFQIGNVPPGTRNLLVFKDCGTY